MQACAINEPQEIGATLEWLNLRYRVVREITREQYWEDVLRNRRATVARGEPLKRSGMYTPETKEFKPMRELPPEVKYFYEIEPA